MCMDYAAAVNEEAHELVKAGADVIQLDEPWLRNNPEEAAALRREGHQPRTAGHHRADGRASLLRLRRRGHRPEAHRLFLPAAALRHDRPADLDRDRRSPRSTSAC